MHPVWIVNLVWVFFKVRYQLFFMYNEVQKEKKTWKKKDPRSKNYV